MKNINPNIVAIGWVSFFTDMASAMLVPILPIYLVSVLNQGADKLGIVLAISSFISYFLRYYAGFLADKMGRVKVFLLVGYAISSIAKPLFYWTTSWQSVASLKSFERLGKAIRTAPKDVLISHYSLKHQLGKGFGFHKMMDIAGELVGSLIVFGLLFFYQTSEVTSDISQLIKMIFLATAAPGIIAVFIALFFIQDIQAPPASEHVKEQNIRETKRNTKHSARSLKRQMLFFFLFSFIMMDEAFFILQSQTIIMSIALIPLLVILNRLVQTLTSYQIGIFSDRLSPSRIMPLAYLFGLLALVCFQLNSSDLLWFGFAFMGLYSVTGLNLMRSMIAAQEESVGHYFGIFYTGMAISLSLGAVFWGFVWHKYGSLLAIESALLATSLLLVAYLLLKFNTRYFSVDASLK